MLPKCSPIPHVALMMYRLDDKGLWGMCDRGEEGCLSPWRWCSAREVGVFGTLLEGFDSSFVLLSSTFLNPPSAALYPGPSLWDGRLSRKSQKRPVGKMESLRSLEHKGWRTQEKAWEREVRGGKEGSGGCCMAKQPDWDMQEASNPGRWVLRRAVTSAQSGKSNPVSKLLKRVTERPERRRTESRRNYTEHQSRAAM